jgi:hypothetical protein
LAATLSRRAPRGPNRPPSLPKPTERAAAVHACVVVEICFNCFFFWRGQGGMLGFSCWEAVTSVGKPSHGPPRGYGRIWVSEWWKRAMRWCLCVPCWRLLRLEYWRWHRLCFRSDDVENDVYGGVPVLRNHLDSSSYLSCFSSPFPLFHIY